MKIAQPSILAMHARRNSRRGGTLEKLVEISQGVVLVRVPQAATHGPGGVLIRRNGPVDFVGCVRGGEQAGRMVAFDAKSTDSRTRLVTSESHLPEHQRRQILAFGAAGAIAGLLAESTGMGRLFWIGYWQLRIRPASVAWGDCLSLGSNRQPPGMADWQRILAAGEAWAQREKEGGR